MTHTWFMGRPLIVTKCPSRNDTWLPPDLHQVDRVIINLFKGSEGAQQDMAELDSDSNLPHSLAFPPQEMLVGWLSSRVWLEH